ncbi:MAG TPA: energy-coupling factor transporter ATPase [Syntrophorhabdales bacterium]|nr:energy-coupling factor transporter ATPase [Syntrophorhabdales bacterium]
MTLALSIRNLTYQYRGQKKPALDRVSLDVARGDSLVIMGPTEAGKSTLAATMNGLVPHFFKGRIDGAVNVLGRNTRESTVAELSERVGMVFQDFEAQLFSTNLELEVAFGPENLGLPREEIVRRVDENLRLVGLAGFKRRSPASLSGGQKQKLAIASILALTPELLVMDEPTTDLDPESKKEIFRITNGLCLREEMTLITVEQETEEVLSAKNVLLLKDGRVAGYGSASEILRRIDLLKAVGVMPPAVPAYFHRMGCESLPLTIEEGLKEFAARRWLISEEAYRRAAEKDERRVSKYGETIVACENLEYTYPGGVKALSGINVAVRRKEIVAIIGQNGGGKTTLAKHLNGLLLPSKGRVFVRGVPTTEQTLFELGRTVGYVFQNPDHQIFSETVFDEVAFGLKLRNMNDQEIKAHVEQALAAVGLTGFEHEDPFSLTKSGRKRVAVASVLALRPDVLILDEPTTGLDYTEQRSMMEMIRNLNEQGCTIIFITHHMWIVAEYAHRVLVLKEGQVLMEGTPREIFARQELAEAALSPPRVTTFSRALGKTMLSIEELALCTLTGGTSP